MCAFLCMKYCLSASIIRASGALIRKACPFAGMSLSKPVGPGYTYKGRTWRQRGQDDDGDPPRPDCR